MIGGRFDTMATWLHNKTVRPPVREVLGQSINKVNKLQERKLSQSNFFKQSVCVGGHESLIVHDAVATKAFVRYLITFIELLNR